MSVPLLVHAEERDSAISKRFDELEKRIEILETIIGTRDANPNKENTEENHSQKILFQDDFEKGLNKWETILTRGGKWAEARGGEIANSSPWRSTTRVEIKGRNINPKNGERFATSARQEDGLSVIFPENQNWAEWYGYRYLMTKTSIDLSGTSLPTVKVAVAFDHFAQAFRWNVVFIGVLEDGKGIADFNVLKKIEGPIEGWMDLEVDLSSVTREKPVRIGIAYGCVNSHHGASSGLHIDDFQLVDLKPAP